MIVGKHDIAEYIPQRQPMIMIDELVEAAESYALSAFEIRTDNIFVEDNVLKEAGLVENIAQTAAAHVGYHCAIKKIPVPLGYIAAVKSLSITKLPDVNSRISTSIRILNQVLDVTLAEGIVKDAAGHTCCSCEMRIFVKPLNS